MERTDESLSTRDLATANESSAGTVTSAEPGAQRSASEDPVQSQDTVRAPGQEDARIEGSPPVEGTSDSARVDRDLDAERTGSTEPAGSLEPAGPAQSSPAQVDGAPSRAEPGTGEPLLSGDLSASFQQRWEAVQTQFVDQPRGAVEEADALVASLMKQLAEDFAQERERLEAQWARGEDISTEDLRVALQRYRSFFQRLLST